MEETRWRGVLTPRTLALAVVPLVLAVLGVARGVPQVAAAPAGERCGRDEATRAGWYRLDERVDPDGALGGYRLALGPLAGSATVAIDLPAEAHAAGPFRGTVLFGADDGRRSILQLADARRVCATLADSRHVIRRATIDPEGRQLYYHLRERTTRADLGIWRQPLAGGQPRAVIPALDGDAHIEARFGPTFSTEFAWSSDGSTLAVQSCGPQQCRTRTLDRASGEVRIFDANGQGELIGLSARTLLAYAACDGLPCPILGIDRANGAGHIVVSSAGLARVTTAGGTPLLATERADVGREAAAIELRDADTGTLRGVSAPLAHGWRLLPAAARALAATETLPGHLPLIHDAAHGRRELGLIPLTLGRAGAPAEVAP